MPAKAKAAIPASAVLPETLSPELATLVAAPPSSLADWIFEVKFDGYRMLARVDVGYVRIFFRDGLDWTLKLQCLQTKLPRVVFPTAGKTARSWSSVRAGVRTSGCSRTRLTVSASTRSSTTFSVRLSWPSVTVAIRLPPNVIAQIPMDR